MSKDVTVIIATHKSYKMPEDDLYLPLHVGAAINGKSLGYVMDNTGENISIKNPSYCELTGLYWAWKNLDSDYIGLAHYRRHFANKIKNKNAYDRVLRKSDIFDTLSKYKVYVPKKRKYYIESLYSHYAHTHYSEQLDKTREIIQRLYPEYIPSYDKVVKRTYGYMFNMMIMRRDYLDKYCSWLFDILFTLEKEFSMNGLSAFQGRFYGRISEIIFNVWLDYMIHSGSISVDEVKELPCIHMEKINWWKKGTSFLKAKFFSKKYEGSF